MFLPFKTHQRNQQKLFTLLSMAQDQMQTIIATYSKL